MARNKMLRMSDKEYAILVKAQDRLTEDIVRRTIGWLPEDLQEQLRDDVGKLPPGVVVAMGADLLIKRLEKEAV